MSTMEAGQAAEAILEEESYILLEKVTNYPM